MYINKFQTFRHNVAIDTSCSNSGTLSVNQLPPSEGMKVRTSFKIQKSFLLEQNQ